MFKSRSERTVNVHHAESSLCTAVKASWLVVLACIAQVHVRPHVPTLLVRVPFPFVFDVDRAADALRGGDLLAAPSGACTAEPAVGAGGATSGWKPFSSTRTVFCECVRLVAAVAEEPHPCVARVEVLPDGRIPPREHHLPQGIHPIAICDVMHAWRHKVVSRSTKDPTHDGREFRRPDARIQRGKVLVFHVHGAPFE